MNGDRRKPRLVDQNLWADRSLAQMGQQSNGHHETEDDPNEARKPQILTRNARAGQRYGTILGGWLVRSRRGAARSSERYHWDCLKVMRTLPDRCIDVVLKSPAYNIGMSSRSYDDRRPREEYLTWMWDIAAEIARLLADDGTLFFKLGATGPEPWIAQDVAAQFLAHLVLQNRTTWVKSITIDGVTLGHQRPINSDRFITRTNEEVYHFTRSGATPIDRLAIGVPYADKSNLKRWQCARADLRCGGNTWFIP